MKNTKFLFPEGKTTDGMVSVSQLMTHMSCPKKWEYNYIEKLMPRVERPFLTVGKLCHKGMQVAMRMWWEYNQMVTPIPVPMYELCSACKASGIDAMHEEWEDYIHSVEYLPEELPEFEKMLNDAISVFSQAFEEFDPYKYEVLTLCKDGKPIPALELHFLVPCPGSKGLHGYIDAILRNRATGFVWCTDYKFRKSLSDDIEEAYNVQNAVYTHACKKMGVEITGTMTWQHCNTPAADPAVNKNGTVSRAKIKTTWEHYAEFCASHGVDPEPYREEMEEKLSDIEWFRATYEYRNEETVQRIWDQVVVPAARAVKKSYTGKNHRFMYPWNCKMCQYQSLCQAELRDYDADAIRERDYTVRHKADNKGIDSNTSAVV